MRLVRRVVAVVVVPAVAWVPVELSERTPLARRGPVPAVTAHGALLDHDEPAALKPRERDREITRAAHAARQGDLPPREGLRRVRSQEVEHLRLVEVAA